MRALTQNKKRLPNKELRFCVEFKSKIKKRTTIKRGKHTQHTYIEKL